MNILVTLAPFTLAIGSFLSGLIQLAWVAWALTQGSLHMGSPLRREGPLLVHLTNDLMQKDLASSVYKTGMLGFDLLGDSLSIHFISGSFAIFFGVILAVQTTLNAWRTSRNRTVT